MRRSFSKLSDTASIAICSYQEFAGGMVRSVGLVHVEAAVVVVDVEAEVVV